MGRVKLPPNALLAMHEVITTGPNAGTVMELENKQTNANTAMAAVKSPIIKHFQCGLLLKKEN